MKRYRLVRGIALVLTAVLCFGSVAFAEEGQAETIIQEEGKASEEERIAEEEKAPEEEKLEDLDYDSLSQEELDALDQAILAEEREKRKEELGWSSTYAAGEERYAALFGAKYDRLDTRGDVEISDAALKNLRYITEPFTAPLFGDLNRRYHSTDIVSVSGHGFPTKVDIGCDRDKVTADNCIGIKIPGTAETASKFEYVLLGKRDLSAVRLMMFVACQTANGGGLPKYAIEHGAKASIGFTVDIDSSATPQWLNTFYTQLMQGKTIEQARNATSQAMKRLGDAATKPDDKDTFYSLANSAAYGAGKNEKLTYSTRTSEVALEPDPFTYIQEPINIDCKTGDLEELLVYLEKNVAGFSRDTCELRYLYPDTDEEDGYAMMFHRTYHGFITNGSILIFKRGDQIFYSSSLDDFKEPRTAVMQKEDIPEELIEQVKKDAVAAVGTTDAVETQKVTFGLTNDYKPYIGVMTTFRDDNGSFWAKSYAHVIGEEI